MRGLIFGIAGSLLVASPAFCQVDTLMLVEIGSIEAPSDITNLYVEDMDGDSLKEIILTTATNIHIYNGITYEVIWTSPELDHPRDLLFADINLDGFIDFSVKDTTNIHLFDPHNDSTIWTSPPIDSTYKCYTIGDRNDDDWVDVAIVSKEWFTREDDPENMDTVWVELFNGPGYSDEDNFVILMENESYGGDLWWNSRSEIPTKILICRLSSYGLLENRIVVISDIHRRSSGSMPNYWADTYTGNIWLIDDADFGVNVFEDTGELRKYEIQEFSGNTYIYILSFWFDDFEGAGQGMITIEWIGNLVSADTLIRRDTLHWARGDFELPPNWRGYIVDEFMSDNSGSELGYLLQDSLTLYSISENTMLWRAGGMSGGLFARHYYSSGVFNYVPNIMCWDYSTGNYLFFDAADGSLSGILLISEDLEFSLTEDIDNNGTYELIAREGNLLEIFLVEVMISMDDQASTLPEYISFANYPNPFNSSTTIEYGLPEAAHVNIEIYDLLGRKVETLMNEEQEAGTYQIVWDAGDRSSGVYFYRITSGGFTEAKRMVLLK